MSALCTYSSAWSRAIGSGSPGLLQGGRFIAFKSDTSHHSLRQAWMGMARMQVDRHTNSCTPCLTTGPLTARWVRGVVPVGTGHNKLSQSVGTIHLIHLHSSTGCKKLSPTEHYRTFGNTCMCRPHKLTSHQRTPHAQPTTPRIARLTQHERRRRKAEAVV